MSTYVAHDILNINRIEVRPDGVVLHCEHRSLEEGTGRCMWQDWPPHRLTLEEYDLLRRDPRTVFGSLCDEYRWP